MRRQPQTVFGHRLPEARATPLGVRLALLYLGLPTLGLLLLFDLLVWAVFELGFGVCVALWCFF